MVEASQFLTLHLKRFDTKSNVKSQSCVDVPCELQLNARKYTFQYLISEWCFSCF